jgi:dephospho-CoA kinase
MRTFKRQGMKIGITGGIGSGKTSVCHVFNILGIPLFSADYEAKMIMENNAEVINGINSIVGKDIYPGGNLDRISLAAIIFNNKNTLEKVNALVHPVVFDQFRIWEMEQSAQYIIMEAAILFESGASRFVDKTVSVVAPIEERIKRIIHRNGLSREQVIARMKNQMDDEDRIKLSDYVIQNSENDMIIPAVLKINEDILKIVNSTI